MTESNDYKTLKKNIVKLNDRINRIENTAAFGMPDVNYCAEEVECWIELKHPKEPVRKTTRLFGSAHKISLNQKNWFKSQMDAGGNAYFLIVTDKRWILVDGLFADSINDMTTEQILGVSSWTAQKPVKKEFWNKLREKLTMKI